LRNRDSARGGSKPPRGRPNLLAAFGAENPARTVLFESHLDTVGVSGFHGDPFALREENGRLYGRGACDTKGPLAAFMAALDADTLAAIRASGVQLLWLGAIGEETGNLGAEEAVAAGIRADACVVLEPTGLRIVHAHKGACWFRVATRGRAAHGSDPARGDNAILKIPAVWQAIEAATAAAPPHPVLGPPTVSLGTIHGGTGTNIVPDHCEIQVDRRFLPGETCAGILDDLRMRLADISGGVEITLVEGRPRLPYRCRRGTAAAVWRGAGGRGGGAGVRDRRLVQRCRRARRRLRADHRLGPGVHCPGPYRR
jgi:acetylornithine deacetylase/succinyl-diaminopimelate desuccinylase-like protein